jgi:hypothetical protein
MKARLQNGRLEGSGSKMLKILAIIIGVIACGLLINGGITFVTESTGSGGSYYDPRAQPELTGAPARSVGIRDLALGSLLFVIAVLLFWYESRNEG